MGPVNAPSDEETDSERADLEVRSDDAKLFKGSPQMVLNPSGVVESARGYGSADLLEALEFRRALLEVLAACASQGTIDSFRNRQLLQQQKQARQTQTTEKAVKAGTREGRHLQTFHMLLQPILQQRRY